MSISVKRRYLAEALLAAALLPLTLYGCLSATPVDLDRMPPSQPPPTQRIFTSTAQVRCLAADGQGGLWAATGGGVLHWSSGLTTPQRWTAADGLPSNDVLRLIPAGTAARAETPTGNCLIDLRSSAVTPLGESGAGGGEPLGIAGTNVRPPGACGVVTASASLPHGGALAASATGLWRRSSGAWQALPLPQASPASHVSALLTETTPEEHTYAALYGDGLYTLRGRSWHPQDRTDACRQITSLARVGNHLVIGTSASGVLTKQPNGVWTPLDPGALPSADIESVAVWHGCTWLATFDQGVLRLPDGACGASFAPTGAPVQNPRALIAAGNLLYCRDADSRLYSFDGQTWQRAPWSRALPRPDIYCCAAEAGQIYIGGWGGWASLAPDAATAVSHFGDAPLAGQDITCIAAEPASGSGDGGGGAVWIGTQGKGLLRYDHGQYTEFHEAQGVTDDWITSICVQNKRVLVGTYTGGLLELRGTRFSQVLNPRGYAVRSIAIASDGAAYAATPLGIYEQAPGKALWQLIDPRRYGGAETQCLCLTNTGMWIGGRTSLGWIDNGQS